MIEKLQGLKRPLLLLGLFLLGVVLYGASWLQGRSLPDQQAVKRWVSDDTRYTQISVFFGPDRAFSENEVTSFRVNLSRKMEEASLKAKNVDARLWIDAYSMETTGTAALGRVNEGVTITAVKGDFFQFHPLPLVSGYYFRPNELMDDRVLIDETLAWKLFGSSNVAGMDFLLNGKKCLVAGVVKDAESKLEKRAYGGKPRVYAPMELVGFENTKITCYEVLLPDPVKGFGKKIVMDYFFGEVQPGEEEAAEERQRTQDIEIVENTARFKPVKLLKLVKNFGIRSMRENQVRYPYWENMARVKEDYAAALLLPALIAFLPPVWFTLRWIRYKWKNRKWRMKLLFDWIERKREASWEKRRKIENEED